MAEDRRHVNRPDESVTRVIEDIMGLWPEAREHVMTLYGHERMTEDVISGACHAMRLWFAARGHRVDVTATRLASELRFTIIPLDVIRKATITGVVSG